MKIEITVGYDAISGMLLPQSAIGQLEALLAMLRGGVSALGMQNSGNVTAEDLAKIQAHTSAQAAQFRNNGETTQPPQQQNDDDGAANPNAPATDVTGLPWDDRIHSKNKAVNADGTWRARRGVQEATVAQVTAELRARDAQGMYMPPQTTAPTSSIPMPDMPAALDRNNPANYTQQPPQYQPPQQQQYAPQGQPPQQQQQYAPQGQPPQNYTQPQFQQQPAPQMDFGQFMGELTKRMVPGSRIDANYLMGVCARLSQQFNRQVNAITDVSADQNMLNAALQMMTADGAWL